MQIAGFPLFESEIEWRKSRKSKKSKKSKKSRKSRKSRHHY